MLKYVNICLIKMTEGEGKENSTLALPELFERDQVLRFSKVKKDINLHMQIIQGAQSKII